MDPNALAQLIDRLVFELRELHFSNEERCSRFDPTLMVGDSGKMSRLIATKDLPSMLGHIADTIVTEAKDLRITLPPAAEERISVSLDEPVNASRDEKEFHRWAMSTLLTFAVREVLMTLKQYGEIVDGENDRHMLPQ